MHNFDGFTVIITGASGNLGRAVAEAFYASGASLALVDRGNQPREEFKPPVEDTSRILRINETDLTDPESVRTMVAGVLDHCGKIDIVINTVGGYRAGTPVHETPLEVWDLMMAINAKAAFLVSREVIPTMIRQKSGKIIHISAGAGLKGTAGHAAYSISKSAVIRLVESLAAELKPYGINVNAILPGAMDTPENRQAMPRADFSKWVKPESIARVILFLASENARDIHGAAVPV